MCYMCVQYIFYGLRCYKDTALAKQASKMYFWNRCHICVYSTFFMGYVVTKIRPLPSRQVRCIFWNRCHVCVNSTSLMGYGVTKTIIRIYK